MRHILFVCSGQTDVSKHVKSQCVCQIVFVCACWVIERFSVREHNRSVQNKPRDPLSCQGISFTVPLLTPCFTSSLTSQSQI